MPLSALDRLRLFLRPAGKGIYIHSTGASFAAKLHRELYGTDAVSDVQSFWEDGLQKIRRVSSILIGVPSDTGAGIMRGANFGPIGIREAYLKLYGAYPKTVLDLGDVIVVPQLLHDSMLSARQIERTREALYPKHGSEPLPVSPLSITEAAVEAILELNPQTKITLLGGDHSVSWPIISAIHKRSTEPFGLLHFDAHTDLLESRLGIQYCYATWAYHAMKLVKPYHLVQVGQRTSLKTKEQWENLHPIHQFWAHEVIGNEKATISAIVAHFKKCGVTRIYITNDIDGTDCEAAPATGTPEPKGLSPEFVIDCIRAAKASFELIGSDIVEVAPPLSGVSDYASEKTCMVAARYLHEVITTTDKLCVDP